MAHDGRADSTNVYGKVAGEWFCIFCKFSTPCMLKFKRHSVTRRCTDARNYLFVCKNCTETFHSLNAIRQHACSAHTYVHDVVDSLKRENDILRQMVYGCVEDRTGPVITTFASKSLEEHRLDLQLDSRLDLPSSTREEIQKRIRARSSWLYCEGHLGLLNFKQLVNLKNDVFNFHSMFTIERKIDVRQLFPLIFMRTEAQYWPFKMSAETSFSLIFDQPYSPFARVGDDYFVAQTLDPLRSNYDTFAAYRNWNWVKCYDAGDLVRYIRRNFVEKVLQMFVSHVRLVCHVSPETIVERVPNATAFFRAWLDTHSVVTSNVKSRAVLDGCVSERLFECTDLYDDERLDFGKEWVNFVSCVTMPLVECEPVTNMDC